MNLSGLSPIVQTSIVGRDDAYPIQYFGLHPRATMRKKQIHAHAQTPGHLTFVPF